MATRAQRFNWATSTDYQTGEKSTIVFVVYAEEAAEQWDEISKHRNEARAINAAQRYSLRNARRTYVEQNVMLDGESDGAATILGFDAEGRPS